MILLNFLSLSRYWSTIFVGITDEIEGEVSSCSIGSEQDAAHSVEDGCLWQAEIDHLLERKEGGEAMRTAHLAAYNPPADCI